MIDVPDRQVETGHIRMLALLNNDSSYCTAVRDWVDIFCRNHPNSFRLNYEDFYRKNGVKKLEEHVDRFIAENGINVVYTDMNEVKAFTLEYLKRLQDRVFVFAISDDAAQYFGDRFKYISQFFDLVVSHDYIEKFRYRLFGVDSVFHPMLSNPEVYFDKETDLDAKDIGVSFVGRTDRMGRQELLTRLEDSGLGLELYGDGTRKGRVTKEQKVDIFRRSKIGLNFSSCAIYVHSPQASLTDKRIRQVKGRLWELALCKTMIITDYAPELERSFEPGRELVLIDGDRDLERVIRHYLAHDDERRDIAMNGFRRAWRDVEPRMVARKLMGIIAEGIEAKRRREPLPVMIDAHFHHYISEQRACEGLAFLRAGRRDLAWEQILLIWRSGRVDIPRTLVAVLRKLARPWFSGTGIAGRLHRRYVDLMIARDLRKAARTVLR